MKICSIEDCVTRARAKGLCGKHYQRARNHGTPDYEPNPARTQLPERRFQEKYVESDLGCWVWIGAVSSGGYGTMSVHGRTVRAHRFSFELHHHPIPSGMTVDHTCFNTLCVNPGHLRLATVAENNRARQGALSRSETGVRNVGWDRRCGKWRAVVTVDGVEHISRHERLEDATAAAAGMREELFGDFAGLG